jgi:hypothetical protein
MRFQCAHRLDRQASRAEQLQVVELERRHGELQGVEDPLGEAPDAPAGAFGFRHEDDVRLVDRELGHLREIMVDQHRVWRQRPRQVRNRVGGVDGGHDYEDDPGFHGPH